MRMPFMRVRGGLSKDRQQAVRDSSRRERAQAGRSRRGSPLFGGVADESERVELIRYQVANSESSTEKLPNFCEMMGNVQDLKSLR